MVSARYMTHESRSEVPDSSGQGMVSEDRDPALAAWRVNGSVLNEWKVLRSLGFKAGALYEGEFPAQNPSEIDPTAMHLYGPAAGLFGSPLDSLFLEGSVSRRGRFPTFKERYGTTLGGNVPNPDLSPEIAWHFGLDLSWTFREALAIHLSGFDSEVDGLIQQVSLGGGSYTLENTDDARLAGAGINVSAKPVGAFRIDAGYAYLYARRLGAASEEERLLYRPEHKLFGSAGFDPFDWWEISTGVDLVGPQRYQNDINNRYGTFGLFALWRAGTVFKVACERDLCFEIESSATNLLDTYYQTRYGFPGQGRRVWLLFRLTADHGTRLGLRGVEDD